MLREWMKREVSSATTATGTSNHSTRVRGGRRRLILLVKDPGCRRDRGLAGRLRWCYDGRDRMAIPRVLLIVGAVGGLTAWVIAQGSPVSGRQEGPSVARGAAGASTTRQAASASRDPAFDMEVDRLRTGVSVMPSPSASGRNPFRFGATSPRRDGVAAHPSATLAAHETLEAATAAADRPPMQLLGVAADENGGSLVRTAVIATPHQLYLVREGQQIAFRFQVTRISSDAVELRDLVGDATFQLALR